MCAKLTLGGPWLSTFGVLASRLRSPRSGGIPAGVAGAILLVTCLAAGGCGRSAKEGAPAGPDLQTSQATAAANAANLGEFVIGQPIQHKNLTIFPVASKTPRNEDRYITLSEGLKAGTVQIFEVGANIDGVPNAPRPDEEHESPLPSAGDDPFGVPKTFAPPSEPPTESSAMGDPDTAATVQLPLDTPQQEKKPASDPLAKPSSEMREVIPETPDESPEQVQIDSDPFGGSQQEGADVNRLMVVNRSDKPLYLMPGEIIYGGQQDRTIAEEGIVAADKKPVAIKVYCVEHGRWGSRDEAQTAEGVENLTNSNGGALDAETRQKLAAEAKQGKFVAQAGSLGKGGRIAVHDDKGQQEVWDKVGQANASSGMTTDSDTFTANYTSPEMLKQLEEYIKALQTPVADHKQVVGAIVAINGKVEAVDVFQSTPLFQKLWPVLLKSHAFDAATAAKEPEAANLATLNDAQEFLQTTMQADVEKKSDSQGGLVVTKRDAKNVMSFSAGEANGAMGGMGGGMGGFGGAVHSLGVKK